MQSKVKAMRDANGWSQEQLAEMAGLSTRTIQRIERGQRAGLESWKSLAAVFDTTINEIQEESDMNTVVENSQFADEEAKALKAVRKLRRWYISIMYYVAVMGVAYFNNADMLMGYVVPLLWVLGATLLLIIINHYRQPA
ncbi:helix-turn-helix domain-containing protein [Psychrobacter sp. I-STPA10]|uniref:helix-turn-helix domain-containing protein n=1 Tax=Psychrobacter sp. I-STPA10 TaxID=2585769 RepID=UPI001E339CE0|nr:helix-turn-helix transcriptional regulator [Psychrobacter sp. I-STPA10]